MESWAILQHVAYEGPGLIAGQARRRGLRTDHRHLYRGDSVPDVAEIGGLVVMGGPMGVADVEAHPHLKAETELLCAAAGAGLPVLGVCLGAQLLAGALGGEVFPAEEREVGPGTVTLTAAGRRDAVFGPAAPSLAVLHWHEDTFSLPPGAELLATSDRIVNQAFRAGRSYGLQFHVELDAGLAGGMRAHLPDGVVLSAEEVTRVERSGRALLARFFDLFAAPGLEDRPPDLRPPS
jgi:GMP synthase (glutamine-hydrolysing)